MKNKTADSKRLGEMFERYFGYKPSPTEIEGVARRLIILFKTLENIKLRNEN